MTGHPRRRRLAAIAVFALAGGALIATSPAHIESSLEASHTGSAELTLGAPRATGRVMLELSPAALPAAGDRRLRVNGSVGFYRSNRDDSVRMSVRAADIDAAPVESDGSFSWPIEQLCRVAERCRREFEVTFEWLDPRPELSWRAAFEGRVRISYEQVEENPDGAVAAWSTTADFAPAPAGQIVTNETNPERLTLDRAHPAAMRHVVLTASGIADAARSVAFVRSAVSEPGAEAAVRFTLIPDDHAPDGAPAASAIDPFVDCPDANACERGLTVLIELDEVEPAAKATIDWSLEAHAEFPPGTAPPDDAEVSAMVDQAVDVDSETPSISASVSGTLAPGPDETGTPSSFTRIVISAEDAGLRLDWASALTPPAVGVLTVRASDDATIGLHVAGDEGTTYAYRPLMLGPARPSAAVLVYPFTACDPGADCTVELWLSATTATPASVGTESVVTVEWDLVLDAYYPGLGTPPADAQLTIDVRADDR